jgi:hypothetical protein
MSKGVDVILIVDCGSTTTKAILIEGIGEEYRLQARGEAPTTVGIPLEDVTMGVRNAINEVEELAGRELLDSQGIITPAQGRRGTDLFLATCSAGMLEREEPHPEEIDELLTTHVKATTPEFMDLLPWTHAPIMPTPTAVGKIIQILSREQDINIIGVDLGGATTDIFSVFDQGSHGISANVGMGTSVCNLLVETGIDNILRWLPFSIGAAELKNRIYNKMVRPITIPHTLEDLLIEQAIAREALALALAHHRTAVGLGGAKCRTFGKAFQQSGGQEGLDMMELELIVGSGGTLSHAPRRVQSAMMLIDGFQPQGVTHLAVDSMFMMPQLGALLDIRPQGATQVLERDCLAHLGTVLAPKGRGKFGEKCMWGKVDWPGGSEEVDISWGDIQLIDGQGPFQLDLHPHLAADIGAGRDRTLRREVTGGVCGLFLDCRGRPLLLAEEEQDRVRQLLRWYKQVGMYPMHVEGAL